MTTRKGKPPPGDDDLATSPSRGEGTPAPAKPRALPFPESLCHHCAAPPRYIESGKGSVFVLCPLLDEKYPRQPVLSCPLFRPR